jgi:hypothetical protein
MVMAVIMMTVIMGVGKILLQTRIKGVFTARGA